MRERPQMRRSGLLIGLWAAVLLACSCHSNGQEQSGHGHEGRQVQDTFSNAVRELPLPAVPSSLTVPEERAAYIIARFWDGMDFGDTLRCRNRTFMEQNFVNYLSLFPHAREKDLSHGIAGFLKAAMADSTGFSLVNDMVEHYLDDPNSPMRNEGYYILFLEELLRLPGLSEYDRIRPAYRLETARKNRPGTIAADFSYTDRNGNRRTMHATRGKRLLLLFYDPACSHCSEILDGLRRSAIISNLIKDKELTVLAVYTEGDRNLWNETKAFLPQEWTVAIDESRIVERELYSLPAMPVIYLLNRNKRVILKDPTPAELEAFFE